MRSQQKLGAFGQKIYLRHNPTYEGPFIFFNQEDLKQRPVDFNSIENF